MAESPRARARAWPSARARIVGWLLLLVMVAMLASTVVTREVLLARMDERIDHKLAEEVQELRNLAQRERFTDVRQIIRANLRRNIPEPNETFVTLLNGRPYLRSPRPPPVRLDRNDRLMARFAAVQQPTLGTVSSEAGAVRYAAVPLRVQGVPDRAVFVAAYFRDLERREIDQVIRVLAGVEFGALAFAAVAGWLIAGQVLAPVRLVRQTARNITDTDLTRRIPVTGNDDVAELARTFNAMLDRLEYAFATQRQFVDDAGHELRTPITIVRGHLELLGDDPEERRATVALVTDELDRMARMVDDLLTLAKAGRPDFLHPGSVDLGVLTDEVYGKAQALARRDWRVEGRTEVVLVADRQRLTQAWVQLAHNAAHHTADGDPIWLGSRRDGDRVELWVRDSGPGVPRGDEERIFARFARGHGASGGPDGPDGAGAGLGLAIVAAIADAHHGRARCANRPGFGATFLIEVPMEGPDTVRMDEP